MWASTTEAQAARASMDAGVDELEDLEAEQIEEELRKELEAAEEAAALESERESALGLRVKARPCCFFFSFSQSPLAFLPRL